MKLAQAFSSSGFDEIKALLDGGVLKLYSVARPANPDAPVIRSLLLATFKFASPDFGADTPEDLFDAVFESKSVLPEGVGTPGFARAFRSDGATAVADFSAGPGDTEINFSDISTTPGHLVSLTSFRPKLPAA